ncbi:MAG: TetR/AcrR family transcriptional regulator [Spirochaetes bacterium]|nr:MAG: TetR/AcrR family transcriptional regulator [Spirochaetota bacterium]
MTENRVNKTQKALIISKSSSLFWEKGYAETSMKDIAGECGFRPANIYNFFENKESILFEILYDEMMEILGPIRSLEDDETIPPPQAMRLVIENHLKLTLGEKMNSKLLFDAGLKNLSPANRKKIITLRDEYDRISVKIIERGIRTGVFRKTDAKMAVYSIASMIARSRIWFNPQGKHTVDEIIDFICAFALNGLGAKSNGNL